MPSADRPTIGEGTQYHIRCKPGDLAPYLLVPGDPERVSKISSLWEDRREVAYHRQFRTHTGTYKGIPISALSSGIGPAAMAIVVKEASDIGVQTIIRVGSTGAIQEGIRCGDLVISGAAVRLDSTGLSYAELGFPAFASYEVLLALIEAAESLGVRYHVGVTATTSDFYAGQERPIGPLHSRMGLIERLQRLGVLNIEMECATLFVVSSLLKLRAGAVCAVYADRVHNVFEEGAGEMDAARVACEAVRILSVWDERLKKKGVKCFFPSALL
ncbi:MAG: nucleoside phosphorylase [Candidatus Bathyarchaeia archaeon]